MSARAQRTREHWLREREAHLREIAERNPGAAAQIRSGQEHHRAEWARRRFRPPPSGIVRNGVSYRRECPVHGWQPANMGDIRICWPCYVEKNAAGFRWGANGRK